MQIAGLRKSWQYEDLIWGLFMNKYIFPGADASTPVGWVVDKLEGAGFEIVSLDNVGVHYSATLWHWYRNWMANEEKVVAKYGKKWFRIWEYFLASSVIVSRQGGASCFQLLLRKNLNTVHRVEHIPRQFGLKVPKPENGNIWLNASGNAVKPTSSVSASSLAASSIAPPSFATSAASSIAPPSFQSIPPINEPISSAVEQLRTSATARVDPEQVPIERFD